MTNYARQIAEMLGLEIGEKFKIKSHPDMGTFWFIDDNSYGLRALLLYVAGKEMYELDLEPEQILEQLLAGFYEVEKLPKKMDGLISRDTPQKPVETEDAYLCPRCDWILAMKSQYLCIPCQNKYCGGCGQHLDWSDFKEE